jgi:hypothetical protein
MRIKEITNTVKPKSSLTPAQASIAGLKRNVEQDKLRLQQERERQRQQRSAEQLSKQRQRASPTAA